MSEGNELRKSSANDTNLSVKPVLHQSMERQENLPRTTLTDAGKPLPHTSQPVTGDLSATISNTQKISPKFSVTPISSTNLQHGDYYGSGTCLSRTKRLHRLKVITTKTTPPSKKVNFIIGSGSEDDDDDDIERPIACSPNRRFLKFDDEIGRGSFKAVYRGLDTESGVSVAWCELQERKLSKIERIKFREEAEMLKRLNHPNIVRFFDYWEVAMNKRKFFVLVTELMTSGTLKSYVKRLRKVNLKILKCWCRQILKGLHFLHSRTPPIIHRDLKCDNIFVTGTTGTLKIGDLGLATLKNASYAKSVIGTPEFMAPEMYEEQYDESVDIYAFGMCILEMVTLEYPYNECNGPAQIYRKVVSGVRPLCYDKIEEEEVRRVVDDCINWNKDERPNVKELLNSEFFAEDLGMKLEVYARDEAVMLDTNKVKFQLQVYDPKKQSHKYNQDEAIQFEYDVTKDDADQLAQDMANSGLIFQEDVRLLSQLITTQLINYQKDREETRKVNRWKTVVASFDISTGTNEKFITVNVSGSRNKQMYLLEDLAKTCVSLDDLSSVSSSRASSIADASELSTVSPKRVNFGDENLEEYERPFTEHQEQIISALIEMDPQMLCEQLKQQLEEDKNIQQQFEQIHADVPAQQLSQVVVSALKHQHSSPNLMSTSFFQQHNYEQEYELGENPFLEEEEEEEGKDVSPIKEEEEEVEKDQQGAQSAHNLNKTRTYEKAASVKDNRSIEEYESRTVSPVVTQLEHEQCQDESKRSLQQTDVQKQDHGRQQHKQSTEHRSAGQQQFDDVQQELFQKQHPNKSSQELQQVPQKQPADSLFSQLQQVQQKSQLEIQGSPQVKEQVKSERKQQDQQELTLQQGTNERQLPREVSENVLDVSQSWKLQQQSCSDEQEFANQQKPKLRTQQHQPHTDQLLADEQRLQQLEVLQQEVLQKNQQQQQQPLSGVQSQQEQQIEFQQYRRETGAQSSQQLEVAEKEKAVKRDQGLLPRDLSCEQRKQNEIDNKQRYPTQSLAKEMEDDARKVQHGVINHKSVPNQQHTRPRVSGESQPLCLHHRAHSEQIICSHEGADVISQKVRLQSQQLQNLKTDEQTSQSSEPSDQHHISQTSSTASRHEVLYLRTDSQQSSDSQCSYSLEQPHRPAGGSLQMRVKCGSGCYMLPSNLPGNVQHQGAPCPCCREVHRRSSLQQCHHYFPCEQLQHCMLHEEPCCHQNQMVADSHQADVKQPYTPGSSLQHCSKCQSHQEWCAASCSHRSLCPHLITPADFESSNVRSCHFHHHHSHPPTPSHRISCSSMPSSDDGICSHCSQISCSYHHPCHSCCPYESHVPRMPCLLSDQHCTRRYCSNMREHHPYPHLTAVKCDSDAGFGITAAVSSQGDALRTTKEKQSDTSSEKEGQVRDSKANEKEYCHKHQTSASAPGSCQFFICQRDHLAPVKKASVSSATSNNDRRVIEQPDTQAKFELLGPACSKKSVAEDESETSESNVADQFPGNICNCCHEHVCHSAHPHTDLCHQFQHGNNRRMQSIPEGVDFIRNSTSVDSAYTTTVATPVGMITKTAIPHAVMSVSSSMPLPSQDIEALIESEQVCNNEILESQHVADLTKDVSEGHHHSHCPLQHCACCSLSSQPRFQQNPFSLTSHFSTCVPSENSHLNAEQYDNIKRIARACNYNCVHYDADSREIERKVSVMSTISNLSADSDYVSGTNTINVERLVYRCPHCEIHLKDTIGRSGFAVKDKPQAYTESESVYFCDDTPILCTKENRVRKISNISTISTLSSLSSDSTTSPEMTHVGRDMGQSVCNVNNNLRAGSPLRSDVGGKKVDDASVADVQSIESLCCAKQDVAKGSQSGKSTPHGRSSINIIEILQKQLENLTCKKSGGRAKLDVKDSNCRGSSGSNAHILKEVNISTDMISSNVSTSAVSSTRDYSVIDNEISTESAMPLCCHGAVICHHRHTNTSTCESVCCQYSASDACDSISSARTSVSASCDCLNSLNKIPELHNNYTKSADDQNSVIEVRATNVDDADIPRHPVVAYRVLEENLIGSTSTKNPINFKLTVLSLNNRLIECQLDSPLQSIIFCLDINIVAPAFTADSLLKANLLSSDHLHVFVEQLTEVIKHMKLNLGHTPVAQLADFLNQKIQVMEQICPLAISENSEPIVELADETKVNGTQSADDAVDDKLNEKSKDMQPEAPVQYIRRISRFLVSTVTESKVIPSTEQNESTASEGKVIEGAKNSSKPVPYSNKSSDTDDRTDGYDKPCDIVLPDTKPEVKTKSGFGVKEIRSRPHSVIVVQEKEKPIQLKPCSFGEGLSRSISAPDHPTFLQDSYESYVNNLQKDLAPVPVIGEGHTSAFTEESVVAGSAYSLCPIVDVSNSIEVIPTPPNTVIGVQGVALIPPDPHPIVVQPVTVQPIYTHPIITHPDSGKPIPERILIHPSDSLTPELNQPMIAHPIPGEPVIVQGTKVLISEGPDTRKISVVSDTSADSKQKEGSTRTDKKSLKIGDLKILEEELFKIHSKPKRELAMSQQMNVAPEMPVEQEGQKCDTDKAIGISEVSSTIKDESDNIEKKGTAAASEHEGELQSSSASLGNVAGDKEISEVRKGRFSITIIQEEELRAYGETCSSTTVGVAMSDAAKSEEKVSRTFDTGDLAKRYSVDEGKRSKLENDDTLGPTTGAIRAVKSFEDIKVLMERAEQDEKVTLDSQSSLSVPSNIDEIREQLPENTLRRTIGDYNIVTVSSDGKLKSDVLTNPELKALLQRQQEELEQLQKRHREEINVLCKSSVVTTSTNTHILSRPTLLYQALSPVRHNAGGSVLSSTNGYSTAPQSPITSPQVRPAIQLAPAGFYFEPTALRLVQSDQEDEKHHPPRE